jgi:hypothetical protein
MPKARQLSHHRVQLNLARRNSCAQGTMLVGVQSSRCKSAQHNKAYMLAPCAQGSPKTRVGILMPKELQLSHHHLHLKRFGRRNCCAQGTMLVGTNCSQRISTQHNCSLQFRALRAMHKVGQLASHAQSTAAEPPPPSA